jgi:hypothetical protein
MMCDTGENSGRKINPLLALHEGALSGQKYLGLAAYEKSDAQEEAVTPKWADRPLEYRLKSVLMSGAWKYFNPELGDDFASLNATGALQHVLEEMPLELVVGDPRKPFVAATQWLMRTDSCSSSTDPPFYLGTASLKGWLL